MSTIDQSQAPAILATSYSFITISTVAVGLRFISRYLKKARYGSDDWTILAGLILFLVGQGLELRGAIALSNFDGSLEDRNMTIYAKYIYIYGPFYFLAVGVTNISVLLLYRRIFSTLWFKQVSMGFICINILWTIPGTIVQTWACNPPSSSWESATPSCIRYGTFWIVIMVIEVVIECCMMALPVGEIRKLHLSTQRKVTIASIFLLGSLVIITAIVRIAECYQGSKNIELNKDALWVNVHVGIAILSACLPTYRGILSPIFDKINLYYSAISNSSRTKSSGTCRGSNDSDHQNNASMDAKLKPWTSLQSHEGDWSDGVRLVEMHNSDMVDYNDRGYTNV